MANEATPLQAPRQAKAAPEKVTQVVGQVMEQARELSRDAKDLRPALANRVKFWFLAPDSVPVHGLLDWPVDAWADALKRHPKEGGAFVEAFCGRRIPSPKEAAAKVKERMVEMLAVDEWELVCRFQNHCTHVAEGRAGSDFHLDPKLFYQYQFDRDFPLGESGPISPQRACCSPSRHAAAPAGSCSRRCLSRDTHLAHGRRRRVARRH